MEHPLICGLLSIAHMHSDSASFLTLFTTISGRTETILALFRIIICDEAKRMNGGTRSTLMGKIPGQSGNFSLRTRAIGLRNSISMGFALMRRKPFPMTLRNILLERSAARRGLQRGSGRSFYSRRTNVKKQRWFGLVSKAATILTDSGMTTGITLRLLR